MELSQEPFLLTEHCGLCSGRLPRYRLAGLDSWRSLFRAIICINPRNRQDENAFILTGNAILPDIYESAEVSVPINQDYIQSLVVTRDFDVYRIHKQDLIAYSIHSWCYSFLSLKIERRSKAMLYKLLRSLTLEHSSQDTESISRCVSQSKRLLSRAESSLQPLLLSTLPIELRDRIWDDIGLQSPYSIFLLVAGETSKLARNVSEYAIHETILKESSYISSRNIEVFGTEYLRNLRCNSEIGDLQILRPVKYLRVILGLRGICAIKILGENWETAWFGQQPDKPCILGYEIVKVISPTVYQYFNGLNIIRISSSLADFPRIVWDHPAVPTTLADSDTKLFDFQRDFHGHAASVVSHRRQLFFKYLSLYNGGEYIKGLTIYISGCGIIGIEAHFASISCLSGSHSGIASHFPLYDEERIAYAWLRLIDSDNLIFKYPALVIQTTLGRFYTFGQYSLPSLVFQNQYKWVSLSTKGYITGFYYEADRVGSLISRLGVDCDMISREVPRLLPSYYNCDYPRIGTPNADLFLSIALVSDIRRLEICRVHDRCIGLLITYDSRPAVAVGQWRTEPRSQVSCIYNIDEKTLAGILFQTKKVDNHKIVTNIMAITDQNEIKHETDSLVIRVGEYMVWWFSRLYDHVQQWEGRLSTISRNHEVNGRR